jgi:hypothetical protein
MFAGACIGVIFLVILLEFLRRLGKEYDRNILQAHQRKIALAQASPTPSTNAGKDGAGIMSRALLPTSNATRFRPSLIQQSIRALLHMLAFAVAYFIMLYVVLVEMMKICLLTITGWPCTTTATSSSASSSVRISDFSSLAGNRSVLRK